MKNILNSKLFVLLVVVGVFIYGYVRFGQDQIVQDQLPRLVTGEESDSSNPQKTFDQMKQDLPEPIEVLVEDLSVPWEIAFLPNGDMLVTERPGRLVLIDNQLNTIDVQGVEHTSEGGLLGVAIHPRFEENNYIYLYFTTRSDGQLANTLRRYILDGRSLRDEKILISDILGARNHDGGRIAFGPDGYLYVTTGDAQAPDTAQDTTSLNGKILRITDDGDIPKDNPFDNAVYSYGHRNPQGIDWDDAGGLWSTEHGPSGPLPSDRGKDELNLIKKGANYGWPILTGEQSRTDMEDPIVQSGEEVTWAPADVAYLNESVYFTGLRGTTLYKYNTVSKQLSEYLYGEFGRLRAVAVGPDDMLYITTSNTDGRGTLREHDDKIIRIDPQQL